MNDAGRGEWEPPSDNIRKKPRTLLTIGLLSGVARILAIKTSAPGGYDATTDRRSDVLRRHTPWWPLEAARAPNLCYTATLLRNRTSSAVADNPRCRREAPTKRRSQQRTASGD